MADKDAIRNETIQSALEFQRNVIAANNSGANIAYVKTDEILTEDMFKLLSESYNIFISDYKKGEKIFQKLYQSMRINETLWIEFFTKNKDWSERIVGILGTYSMLLRQKKEYITSRECVDGWYTKSLSLFRKHVESYTFKTEKEKFISENCLHNLNYKYLVIKFNLLMNMNDLESLTCIDVRDAIKFEIELGYYDRNEDQYAWFIEPLNTVTGKANLETLKKISDESLLELFKMSMIKFVPRSVTGLSLTKYPLDYSSPKEKNNNNNNNNGNNSIFRTENITSIEAKMVTKNDEVIKKCSICSKTIELKLCSKCKQVSYCSIACQKEDWSIHKKYCKA